MQSQVYSQVIFGLLSYIASYHVSANQVSIITSKAYITNLCESNCQQTTEKSLIGHCERGCRFFYLIQTANLQELNTSSSTLLCVESCREAYSDDVNQATCILGCYKAREEIDHLKEKANLLLEEAEREMNVFNSIFSKIASSFWSPFDENEGYDIIKDHEMSDSFHLWDNILGNMDVSDYISNDAEILAQKEDTSSIDPTRNCTNRIWLHRLSFVLVVMGILSLLLISSVYIITSIRNKKASYGKPTVGELSNPPSYETLVSDGIIATKNAVTLRPEPDDKPYSV